MKIMHQTLPSEWSKREELRNKGQFWTPDWVAKAMVSYVLDNSTTSVFDPATGRGAFFNALKKINKNIKFFGTDIDKEVLKDNTYKEGNCIVEERDFLKSPPQNNFSAIVANPPYIRHHRLDYNTKLMLKKLALNITGTKIDGRAGYHIYFLIQALNKLENNGKLAFIMPADTCEGTFSTKLWAWITRNYCLECVITFDGEATPFPGVDTNAVVFLIKKTSQREKLYWVRVKKAYSDDLVEFVKSDFVNDNFATLSVQKRSIKEALQTGLSRPEQKNSTQYVLSDFAKVMRGIATGANEFFFLRKEEAEHYAIPKEFIKLAIGRTKDTHGDILTRDDIEKLEKTGRPTCLLSFNKTEKELPASVISYIQKGVELGLPNRSLIKQRKPWYKMEERKIPPLLFTYLGRKNTRFIKNKACIVPLTGFLCIYPLIKDEKYIESLWTVLNHPDTIKNLILVGKSYGSGSIKVEPRNLERLPIPDYLVEKYELTRNKNKLTHYSS